MSRLVVIITTIAALALPSAASAAACDKPASSARAQLAKGVGAARLIASEQQQRFLTRRMSARELSAEMAAAKPGLRTATARNTAGVRELKTVYVLGATPGQVTLAVRASSRQVVTATAKTRGSVRYRAVCARGRARRPKPVRLTATARELIALAAPAIARAREIEGAFLTANGTLGNLARRVSLEHPELGGVYAAHSLAQAEDAETVYLIQRGATDSKITVAVRQDARSVAYATVTASGKLGKARVAPVPAR